MASLTVISDEDNENQQNLEDLEPTVIPPLPTLVPEDISSFREYSAEVFRPPIAFNGGRFLTPEEFISFWSQLAMQKAMLFHLSTNWLKFQ